MQLILPNSLYSTEVKKDKIARKFQHCHQKVFQNYKINSLWLNSVQNLVLFSFNAKKIFEC